MLNLDTHILIEAFEDDLKPAEEKLLSKHEWGISAIVLWEITKLSQLGRISIDLDDRSFAAAVDDVHVWAIDREVCRALKRLDFKADPADEIIAATSLVYGFPLVTRDKRIRQSKVVPLAL